MEILQKNATPKWRNGNNPYFCRMEKGKEIECPSPETESEIPIGEHLKSIFEKDHSGEMSYEEFEERLKAYYEAHKNDPVALEEDLTPYTLEELHAMVEEGRRQIEAGECYTTEEVIKMCEEELFRIITT